MGNVESNPHIIEYGMKSAEKSYFNFSKFKRNPRERKRF